MDMLFFERDLAREIAYVLPMYRDHSRNGAIKVNFRCPICGDSAKDKYKARGWFYEANGHVRFGCFNCGRNFQFTKYLELYDQERWKIYLKEKYKNEPKKKKPEPKKVEKKKVESVEALPYCTSLADLPETHPCVQYLLNRKMPRDKLGLFFFTAEWKKLSNYLNPGTYEHEEREYRLVIPIYNIDKTISMIQGRALGDVDKNQRYLTVKKDPDALKVFGMERIDPKKTVYFHEGPIDSVFIPNSVAIVGGNMALEDAPYPNNRVWVLDNEPRSIDTVERIEKLISAGEKVVLWDEIKFISKDVNDMILKEGATASEIETYFKQNTVSGLSAKMRLAKWRRC